MKLISATEFQFGSILGGGDSLTLKPFTLPTSTISTTQGRNNSVR